MHPVWIALIPAYQPTEQLISLVQEAKSEGFQIVVINDGSNTGTNDIFASADRFGTVLHHVKNMGKGQAIKTGLSFIQGNILRIVRSLRWMLMDSTVLLTQKESVRWHRIILMLLYWVAEDLRKMFLSEAGLGIR